MQEPLKYHMLTALCAVRCLTGCPNQGIMLKSDFDMRLEACCDSNWSACPITRRYFSVYVAFLDNSLVSWKKKRSNLFHNLM